MKQTTIIVELACEPAVWMIPNERTGFTEQFVDVKVSEPDKLIFTAELENEDDIYGLIYDIEDYLNERDIDYMDVYEQE